MATSRACPGHISEENIRSVSTCGTKPEYTAKLAAHLPAVLVTSGPSKSHGQPRNALTLSDAQSAQPSSVSVTPFIEPSKVATGASVPMLSPPAGCHTIVTDSGYTVVLQPSFHEWRATVHDNRFPGFSRSFYANVKFETGYTLKDFLQRGSSYQSRHIKFFSNKDHNLVYVGSSGLKGGGPLNWFGLESCTSIGCFDEVWRCDCGFHCPNDLCWVHCTAHYEPHMCSGCKKKSRCPQYYKCTTCSSKTHCSNCCGCYERQRQEQIRAQQERERQEQIRAQKERERQEQIRAQKERERQEQIRAQKERERQDQIRAQKERERQEQIRAQQERERQDQIRAQKERERQDQIRAQKERERQEQIRAQQERERQEQIRAQKERERQEQIRAQKERERQEQIRAQKERERQDQIRAQKERERQDQIRAQQERERLIEIRERQDVLSKLDNSIALASIPQKDASQFLLSSSTAHAEIVHQSNQEDTYVHDASIAPDWSNLTIDSDSDGDSSPPPRYYSCESIVSLDEFYENYDNHESDVDNSNDDHNNQESGLSEAKLQGSILKDMFNIFGISSVVTPFIISYIDILSSLQKSVIDYFKYERTLNSLLKQLLSYEDSISRGFRTQWLKITEQYSNSDQATLLKSLVTIKAVHEFTLLDISDIIGLILFTGRHGYDTVCNTQNGWLLNLKTIWLEAKLSSLPQFSLEERTVLGASLANMDWGISMMDQLIKSIREEDCLDTVVELLSVIKLYHVSDCLVLPTITGPSTVKSKVKGWTHTIVCHSLLHKLTLPPKETEAIAIPLLKLLQSSCSTTLMDQFITNHLSLIEAHPANFTQVLELLYNYQVTEEICTSVFSQLSQVNPADWENTTDQMVISVLFQDSQVLTISQLIDQISNESATVTTEWLTASYNSVQNSYISNSLLQSRRNKNKLISDWNKEDVAMWAKQVQLSTTISQPELIAGVKRAVELQHQLTPRDTQILSLLTLLNPSEGMGRLAQINTGEGKSLIVAMLAAIHALQKRKVDVITTSTELSIPEVEKQKPFFDLLSLTVAENSNILSKQSAYQSDVVYGIAGDFQADILRTEFLGQDIRGERGFSLVIVDEVDSMLFDNRTHSVRLSEQAPAMVHLELPLAAVWEHMKRTARHLTTIDDQTFFIAEDFVRNGKEITVYSDQDWESCAVLVDDKRSFIMKQTRFHLDQLLRELSDEEKKHYEAYKKINTKIINLEEKICKTNCSKEKQKLEDNCKSLSENLKSHPWNEHYPVLIVPIHLRDFSRSQVPFWIKSALNAAYGYKKGAHYSVLDGRIVPVHYNETGVLQSNMVWSDGLTQFLQLKEGLRMDPEGVATNFISNVSFFQRYGHFIYGLTGTLGEQPTKDYLQEIYHTDTIIIPPYQRRTIVHNAHSNYLCKELVPVVLSSETEWFQTVIGNVLSHARRQRSVLVICKYIYQVEDFANELCKRYDDKKVFTYTGENANFIKQKIDSGEIIVATIIAGRGKDLETSPSVESHGGMYVAVTFLPETYRVEMQNVGRTARSGKKGMAQLIICDPFNSDIGSIKQHRNEKEIADTVKATYDTRKLLFQDLLFRDFCSLENEFLPTVYSCELSRKWLDFKVAHQQYQDQELTVDKIAEHVNKRVLTRTVELMQLSLGSLNSKETSQITEDDKRNYCEKAARQAESERPNFELEFKRKVLRDFCRSQSHLPSELIYCLWEGRVFEPKCSALAKKYHWGLFDRKGFEEDWGFWLKGEHFEEEDISLKEARERFIVAFATPSKARAQKDHLVRNPYFYVLKGNEYLGRSNLEQAIACYDRAIDMDPDFSVNALYNKGRALLSYEENHGYRQKSAQRALSQAKEIISAISRPALLTFSTLISQDGVGVQTSEHVQHQLNLLSQQENYIGEACKIIETARDKGHHVKLTTQLISETLNSADQAHHTPAIREAAINGLTHLFTVTRVEPIPWGSILTLALISVAQICAGCFITACTGGALGIGLITEGISDMITAAKSAITGSFDWASWAIQKAISLAVSLICSGIGGLKKAYQAGVNTAKDLITVGATKNGVKLAARSLSTALAKGVVKKCLTDAGEWCTNKLFLGDLEKTIEARVEKVVTEALLNNPLVVKALELDVKNKNNFWQHCFIEEGMSLLNEKKEHVCLTMLREISLGVAKNKIPYCTQLLQVAGVANMLGELANYTNDFIGQLNKNIASHQSKVESCVQQIESTKASSVTTAIQDQSSDAPHIDLEEDQIVADTAAEGTIYTSKNEPSGNSVQTFYSNRGLSSPQSLAEAFKIQIAHKLINSVKANLVNPAIGYGVDGVTKSIFSEADKVNKRLLKEVRTTRDRRHFSNKLATAKSNSSADSKPHSKLNESARKGIERLKRDVPLDVNDLAALAAIANAPIHVYDKETGKLVDIVGDSLPGKPCFLVHEKSTGSDPGHWKPMDGNIVVDSSGSNNCLVDAVFAQMDQGKKKELRDVNGLKEKMIDVIQGHPEAANEAYETREKLQRIAPRELMIGGKEPGKPKRPRRLSQNYYPSHENRIVADHKLNPTLASLRNELNNCMEKAEKFDKLTRGQQSKAYKNNNDCRPTFGLIDKTECMMGALDVTFNDNTTLKLVTISGDSPFCNKIYFTDDDNKDQGRKPVPFTWEKDGYKFVDPGDPKSDKVYDVYNRQETAQPYTKSCAAQKLMNSLTQHMKENPSLTIKGDIKLAESWYLPRSKSNFTAEQVILRASCDKCEEILPLATGGNSVSNKKNK